MANCNICGKNLGLLTGKITLSDGAICSSCWLSTGFDGTFKTTALAKNYSTDEILALIDTANQNKLAIENFKATHKVKNIAFDDNSQTFIIKSFSGLKSDLFRYDQIVNFELLQDGESISEGGLGGAVVGSLLFGGVGAIVGGVTGRKKNKAICNSLQIKITFRDCVNQTVYLPFIKTQTPCNSSLYKLTYKTAQDTLSALQLAVNMANSSTHSYNIETTNSSADEILKFKQLLDAGIITEEEFNKKKTQLLGL